MRQLQHALLSGLRGAAPPRLALPLYLTGLALGLLQAWPAASAGAAGPLLEPLALGQGEALIRLIVADAGQSVGPGAALWLLLALGATLAYACAYNLFSGGMLSVMAGRRGFWAGGRRFFWAFTGLGALLVLLALLAMAAGALVGWFAGLAAGAATALALLQLVGLLGEYGRAAAVAADRANPVAALGRAGRFIAGHLPGVLALGALGLLLHGAVTLAYGAVGAAGYLALVAQQLAALAWVWVKGLRLGWAMAYLGGAGGVATSASGAADAHTV
jgi:hypothetical protein